MAFINEDAVEIIDLGFSYPGQDLPCLYQVNLRISKGERFGLFGPNGAGKTTLMNCMTGLHSAQRGIIRLFGNEMAKHDKSLNKLFGFVPQDFSLYQELSPVENLSFFGAWYGLSKKRIKERTEELLELLDLVSVRHKQVIQFSGGMKRRVNLAIGVIHQPALLFLDEPTVGVDIHSRIAIINYLKDLNNSGTTLIYTSHQLGEAEELCDKIALIDNGKIIVHGSLQDLLNRHEEDRLEGLFLNLTGRDFRV